MRPLQDMGMYAPAGQPTLAEAADQDQHIFNSSTHGIGGLFHNSVLWVSIACFTVAQLSKFVIVFIETKQFQYERLVGSGGMPSAHSAFVMGLATAVAIRDGTSSSTFAVALVLAAIVMYDAVGLRLHAGKHAAALNLIIAELPPEHPVANTTTIGQLKEQLGHTPAQVAAGGILGFVLALIVQGTITAVTG